MGTTEKTLTVEQLDVRIHAGQDALYTDAAQTARQHLGETLDRRESAAAILATGNSQIRFLERLIQLGGTDWSRVTLFHMDEYLGLPADHPAGFRHYLKERVEKLVRPRAFHYLRGDADEPIAECDRYTKLLEAQPIDLCMMGVGENGHLAFNDPHVANFEDPRRVKIVSLDETCRMQQVKQGHFKDIRSMPQYALTLTIPTLLSATRILCLAPEARKQIPVKNLLEGPIATDCPASILRTCPNATLFLDQESAALL